MDSTMSGVATTSGIAHHRWSPETAKGRKSRTVPIVAVVKHALEQQKAVRRCGPTDQFWTQRKNTVWKYVSDAAKRAKIPPLCVHDLRRTFGTRCAVAGMPLPQLQKIMGHASAEMTMRYYVHVQEAELRSEAYGTMDERRSVTSDLYRIRPHPLPRCSAFRRTRQPVVGWPRICGADHLVFPPTKVPEGKCSVQKLVTPHWPGDESVALVLRPREQIDRNASWPAPARGISRCCIAERSEPQTTR